MMEKTKSSKVASLMFPVPKPCREPCGGFCPSILASGPEMKAASCVGETWNKSKILSKKSCPIKFCKLFRDHRREEMNQPCSPFFLAIRHGSRRESSEIWYMKAPLGKKSHRKFLSAAADNAGIQRIRAKVSNHSVRKTSISRLLDASTPENFVAQLIRKHSKFAVV